MIMQQLMWRSAFTSVHPNRNRPRSTSITWSV